MNPPFLPYQSELIISDNVSNIRGMGHRDIKNPQINEVWSCELTYLKYQSRFLYLSAIQDIVSKEIIACNLSDKHDSKLTLKTIKEAVLKYGINPRVFHCDRGKENLSENCINYFKNIGTKISVSDPGSPWQNGHAESFFSRFKAKTGDLNRFEDLGQLTEYVYRFINYYNTERIITRLKTSPAKYKQSLRICS